MQVTALAGPQAETIRFILSFIEALTGESAASFQTLSAAAADSLGLKEDQLPALSGSVSAKGLSNVIATIAAHSRLRSYLKPASSAEQETWLSWLSQNLPLTAESASHLNTALSTRTFIVGRNLSVSDLALFMGVGAWLRLSENSVRLTHCHLVRWFNHLQHLEGVTTEFQVLIDLEKLEASKMETKVSKSEKSAKAVKTEKPEKNEKSAKTEERALDDFSRLDVVVGRIVKVWPHPEAERLWCEEIDCGESVPRKIASGLREHYTQQEMEGRMVIVLANLKPRPLRGFESHGMVLCASSESVVELLVPPVNAKPGDRVKVEGYDGVADSVLNPKKNPLDAIAPFLSTGSQSPPQAAYRGLALTVNGEPVTAKTAQNTPIH